MNIGQIVMVKKGLSLIKCVVVDIDATYVTLHMEYKKGKGTDFKMKLDSKEILKAIDTEAFIPKNNLA